MIVSLNFLLKNNIAKRKQLESDEQAREERQRVREKRRQSRDFELDPDYIQRINDMVMLRIAGKFYSKGVYSFF